MSKRDYSYLVSIGFDVSEQMTSEFFGDFYDVLVSSNYELIFSSSKSFKSLNIRKTGDEGEGFDFALVRALILNECCLNKQMSIEALELFLKENFEKVNNLFVDDNYRNTRTNLERLENERARQMFPKAFD